MACWWLCLSMLCQTPVEVATETVIAGRSVAAWRDVIATLDYTDSASTAHVPGLIALVETRAIPWVTRRQAALTLGRLGPLAADGVPVLLRILQAPCSVDPETQLWAVKGLGLYGPAARSAVPGLWQHYHQATTSVDVRLTILEAAARIGTADPENLAQLIMVAAPLVESDIHDEAALCRRAAVEALGVIGPAAAAALPVLLRALDDPDEHLRREAVASLGKLGVAAESAVTAVLERLLLDDSPAVQDQAAAALIHIGPPIVGPEVALYLTAEEIETRLRIVQIYGAWGPAAKPWIKDIQKLANDPAPSVQLAALQSQWQIMGDVAGLATQVVPLFASEDRDVRRGAYRLWTQCDSSRLKSRDAIVPLTMHPHPEVRRVALRALQDLAELDDVSTPGIPD
jgi:HEAT repeat protein